MSLSSVFSRTRTTRPSLRTLTAATTVAVVALAAPASAAGHRHHHHGHHGHSAGANLSMSVQAFHAPAPHHVHSSPVALEDRPSSSTPAIFGPQSEFLKDVTDAPVAPNSAALVNGLVHQVTDYWNGVGAFNDENYNVSFYSVRSDTPTTRVTYDDCQGKGYTPPQLYDPAYGAMFVDVPIPANAVPAGGTDGELTVYRHHTDQLWEFWQAHKEADGWHACWGGRLDNVSQSKGYYPDGTGVAATGLSTLGGAIRIQEARQGVIKHAVSLALIDVANWQNFSYPAQRSDGGAAVGTPNLLEEGQRLRLDPTLDLSTLHLTPLAHMIAVAAQKYGFIITDRSGAVAVNTESGLRAQNASGTNPWVALKHGVASYSIMENFPWDKLQALPVDYGKPSAS